MILIVILFMALQENHSQKRTRSTTKLGRYISSFVLSALEELIAIVLGLFVAIAVLCIFAVRLAAVLLTSNLAFPGI